MKLHENTTQSDQELKLFVVVWRHRHGLDTGLTKSNNRDILANIPHRSLIELVWGECDFDDEDERRLKNDVDHLSIMELENYDQTPVLAAEVTSNGRTVWVNAPNCIGRFSKYLAEIMPFEGDGIHNEPDWCKWVEDMKDTFNVTVSSIHRPLWVEESS